MPILIILTWCIFSPGKALVVSLFEVAVMIIDRFLPGGSNNRHTLSNAISAIAFIVVIVPLVLVILSQISQGGDDIPAIIWQSIVSYFEIFDKITSIQDFADAVSDLIAA